MAAEASKIQNEEAQGESRRERRAEISGPDANSAKVSQTKIEERLQFNMQRRLNSGTCFVVIITCKCNVIYLEKNPYFVNSPLSEGDVMYLFTTA